MATLTDAHLKIGVDGNKWLIKPRQKTGISERVPLLLPALRILDKYAGHSSNQEPKTLLPIPSNQKVKEFRPGKRNAWLLLQLYKVGS
ncbi:MAG TPA: hypothetical protein VFW07_07255 [Parafilimonas sp.]|nr:hypothetical protein [Parafilimonas sp.]